MSDSSFKWIGFDNNRGMICECVFALDGSKITMNKTLETSVRLFWLYVPIKPMDVQIGWYVYGA